MAVVPTECYRRNLSGLRLFQPRVANRVEQTPVPADVVTATGRDGSPTFLMPSISGGRLWFGGSSMPGISAPEVFAGFCSDGQNVALPGVLTGLEPRVIAGRMPAHTALFVVEGDPVHLKLALHLCDYGELLSAGRLVFVVGEAEESVSQLCAFFEEHPGYELPAHLLSVPSILPARVAQTQRVIEQAGETVTASRTNLVQSQVSAILARTIGPLPDAPRVAVLGLDPSAAAIEQAARVARACAALGWAHAVCVPDRPRNWHVAARFAAIEAVGADLVLFVNGPPGSMGPMLPEHLPVASWLLPGTVTPIQPAPSITRGGVAFVSSRVLYDELVRTGVPSDGVEHLAMGADDAVFRLGASGAESGDQAGADVAVLADLPDDRPEACGVTLASHLALWHAMRRRLARNADRFGDEVAEEMLASAERDSGTRLQDPVVRRHFLALLRARIAPAVLARTSAERLVGEGYRVALWGHHWPADGDLSGMRRGPIPVGTELTRVLETARIVVLPIPTAASVQTALDAMAGGACVFCRRTETPLDHEYPGLASLAPHWPSYRTSGELLNAVRLAGSRCGAASDPQAKTRVLVRDEHTASHRLVTIVNTMRRRQGEHGKAV